MSEVIRNARLAELAAWQAPSVGATRADGEAKNAQQRAVTEGYERGLAQGLQAGEEQIAMLHAQLEAMLVALQSPLDALDDQVMDKLASLAVRIARRLVRRELRTNRSEVIAVVREALAVLPLGLQEVRIHLHPEDARLVSETLAPADGKKAWTLVQDPVITRGGCRISSSSSQIDATVETRLARVINTVLGGERDADQTDGATA